MVSAAAVVSHPTLLSCPLSPSKAAAVEEEQQRAEEELLARRQKAEEDQQRVEEASIAHRREAEGEEEDKDEKKEEEERQQQVDGQCQQKQRKRADKIKCAQPTLTKSAHTAVAQKVVAEFLKARGFKQMRLPRKGFCGASRTYALHVAAEENNIEVVRAMMTCGAYLQPKDLSQRTPLDVAEECSKGGSHDDIVRLLRIVSPSVSSIAFECFV